MLEVDKTLLAVIRAQCDLIESCEGDDILLWVTHRALYDTTGKMLSQFAQQALKKGVKPPPKKGETP